MHRPRSSTLVAGVLGLLVLGGLFLAPVAATPGGDLRPAWSQEATAPTTSAMDPPLAATNTTAVDPDAVVMSIDVATNGSAHWRVAYRLRLEDENATAAFESLQADVAANETAYTVRFARRMNRTVTLAANSTGRPMSLGSVSVSTRRETLPQEYGIVAYEFRWFGFAETMGERLRIGDAISGLYLDRQTTLRVRWSEQYALRGVAPEPDERQTGAVIWRGPTEFAGDQPRMTIAPATPTPANAPGTTAETATPQPASGQLSWLLRGVALLAIAALAVFVYRRRGGPTPTTSAEHADDGAASTPAELLSNEERMLQLLEANGGRMKQQAIADELEWTDAKTSQVVGDLRDADDVETFRLGRENVVTLPDAGGPIE
jgi:hypothetical protein